MIEKFLSAKLFVAMVPVLWWLVTGTVTGRLAEFGWYIVAVVLGYLAAEGARDALQTYWRGDKQ